MAETAFAQRSEIDEAFKGLTFSGRGILAARAFEAFVKNRDAEITIAEGVAGKARDVFVKLMDENFKKDPFFDAFVKKRDEDRNMREVYLLGLKDSAIRKEMNRQKSYIPLCNGIDEARELLSGRNTAVVNKKYGLDFVRAVRYALAQVIQAEARVTRPVRADMAEAFDVFKSGNVIALREKFESLPSAQQKATLEKCFAFVVREMEAKKDNALAHYFDATELRISDASKVIDDGLNYLAKLSEYADLRERLRKHRQDKSSDSIVDLAIYAAYIQKRKVIEKAPETARPHPAEKKAAPAEAEKPAPSFTIDPKTGRIRLNPL